MIYRINKNILLEEASAVKTINKHDKIVAAVGYRTGTKIYDAQTKR